MSDILPNPLQELAARLRQELIAIAKEKAGDDAAKLSFAGVLINAITPALGTLLQAEREAERKLTLEAAAKWFDERMIKTHGYPSYIGDTLRSLSMDAQFATGEASALSAVVQRETAEVSKREQVALKAFYSLFGRLHLTMINEATLEQCLAAGIHEIDSLYEHCISDDALEEMSARLDAIDAPLSQEAQEKLDATMKRILADIRREKQ